MNWLAVSNNLASWIIPLLATKKYLAAIYGAVDMR